MRLAVSDRRCSLALGYRTHQTSVKFRRLAIAASRPIEAVDTERFRACQPKGFEWKRERLGILTLADPDVRMSEETEAGGGDLPQPDPAEHAQLGQALHRRQHSSENRLLRICKPSLTSQSGRRGVREWL